MDCFEARRRIAAGLRPGSTNRERTLLGFHLVDCPACREVLAEAVQEEQLLQQLLAAHPTPAPPASAAHSSARSHWRRWAWVASLLVVVLIGVGLFLSQGHQAALATVPGTPAQPSATPLVAGGVELPPDIDTAPTATAAPSPTARPSATPRPTATPTPTPTATPQPLQPLNILLLGLDRRPDETDVARSDALIILHLDPENQQIALLSLPRDLWVGLPDRQLYVKINAAYMYGELDGGAAGGAALARQTISTVIGQPINYTIVTTFEGMIAGVDVLGGIDVDVQKYIYDPRYPTFDYGYMEAEFTPGVQHMDGATALIYSRTRHADNDFERGKRQQQVLIAIMSAFQQASANDNSDTISQLLLQLYATAEYTDLDPLVAAQLARWVNNNPDLAIKRDSVDLRYGYETSTSDGAYIIQPDLPAIQGLATTLFGTE